MYYLMQFFRMSITNRKAAVCLSAFLFGPAYLFYRKMWKEGLLTAILTIVLSIPTFIEIISVFNPSLLGAMPLGWLPVAVNVCAVASWALNIILGLFAVSWYRREAKKKTSTASTPTTLTARPAPMPCCRRAARICWRRCSTSASCCCLPRWSSIWPGPALYSTPCR